MKKVISFLFAAVIIFSSLTALISVSAAGKTAVVSFKPYLYSKDSNSYVKTSSVKGGETLYVSVELTSVSSVGGFSFKLKYDNSAFSFEKAKLVNNINDSKSDCFVTDSNGTVILSWDTVATNTSLSGTLFYLPFTVNSNSAQNTYSFISSDVTAFESNKNQSNINVTVGENAVVTLESVTVPASFLELVTNLKNSGIHYNPNNVASLPADSLSAINEALSEFAKLNSLEQSAFYNNYRTLYDFLTTAKNKYYEIAKADSEQIAREEAAAFVSLNSGILNSDFMTILSVARASTEEEFKSYSDNLTSSYDALSSKAKSMLSQEVLNAVKKAQENCKAAERTVKFENRYSTYIGSNYEAVLSKWQDIHSTDYIFVSEALAAYNALPEVARNHTTEYENQLNNLLKLHLSYSEDAEHEAQLLEKITEFQNRYIYVFMLNSNNVKSSDIGAINMVLEAYNNLTDNELKERLSSRISALKAILESIEEEDADTDSGYNGAATDNNDNNSGEVKTVTKTNTVTKLLNKIYSSETGLRTPFVVLIVMLLLSVVTAVVSMYLWTVAKTKETGKENVNA